MKFFITNLTIVILITGLTSCASRKNSTSERQVNQKTTTNKVKKTTDVKEPESKEENISVTKEEDYEEEEEVSDPSIHYLYKTSTEDYIKRFSSIAQTKMRKYKIPASIILAQGILESNSGNSTLSVGYNNHFGIKCHENWYGDRTYYDDDKKNECFRAYQNPEESYEDHALFLTKRSRYNTLFTYDITDYSSWAHGLKAAGYATDKHYANKLISLIERYNLSQYDIQALNKPKEEQIIEKYDEVIQTAAPSKPADDTYTDNTDPNNYHIVKKGETLEQIAQMYGMTKDRLKSINSMYDEVIYPHQRLTLVEQPKTFSDVVRYSELTKSTEDVVEKITENPSTSEPIETQVHTAQDTHQSSQNTTSVSTTTSAIPDYHKVKEGETLESIADLYGMTIDQIIEYNGMLDNKVYTHMILKLKNQDALEQTSQIIPVSEEISEEENPTKPLMEVANQNSNYHIVNQGETLYSISKQYNVSVDELKALNNLDNNEISVGQMLVIAPINKEEPSEMTLIHTVKQGETLYSISKQYNVSVESIKTMNELSDNNLNIGQVLKIK